MKKFIMYIVVLITPYILTGCAHKINITPKMDGITEITLKHSGKINKNVGYYISYEDRNKYVVTPGGGGDKIEYSPYKDTESSLRLALLQIFSKVYSLESLNDTSFIKNKDIKYIFIPTIYTTSYSDSLLTWPATNFTFELRCYAINNEGKEIWSEIIYSQGNATFSEFRHNFGLSAQRATEEAFIKLIEKIDKSSQFN